MECGLGGVDCLSNEKGNVLTEMCETHDFSETMERLSPKKQL